MAVGAIVWVALTASGVLAPAAPAHAADTSAVTVSAKDQDTDLASAPMPDLSVTVSQTQHLTAQGIRINWTGGKKSIAAGPGNGGENFLQIFMCWGDDPSNANRPDRTTCEYGGASSPGATRDGYRPYALADIPTEDQPYSAPSEVSFLPPFTSIPFVARDKTRVDGITTSSTGVKSIDSSVDVNNNQFFTNYSTNEIPWVGSGNNGKGGVSFEVQTAAQSSGLGCGTAVTANGQTTGAGCWLVILPRGTSDNGSINITQSGLFIDSWKHALAVRLGFEPIGARCQVGADERQLAGSELATLAVNSWQPVVCQGTGASIYSLLTMPESDAVAAAATTPEAPLALTSYPWKTDGTDPLSYAPIALSGLAVSVAIDRRPDPFKTLPANYTDAARTPFTTVNLTPRLLAKLLSYSYRSALPPGADTSYMKGTAVYNITKDPDFLAVNDAEWAAQDIAGAAVADIMIPQGRSDAARAVWAYIAADADARDFLSGKADPWGMVVNPWYLTSTSNPSGTAFSLDRDDFPKADPIEADGPNVGPVNIVTWRPFSNDLGSVAYLTLRGDGQLLGTWDQFAIPPKYNKGARMLPGDQALVGLTTTSSASRYQVVTASLRNPAGSFVTPTTKAMQAAAAAMTPIEDGNGTVLGFQSASSAAKGAGTAYPLTLPVYAAANPAESDADLRTAYAAFIRYAVSAAGQTPGVDIGTLPDGYAPIPAGWATAATTAATTIATGSSSTPNTSDSNSGSDSGSDSSFGGSSSAGGAEAPQPSASGTASPTLSSSVTPADPKTPAGPALGFALVAGLASGLVSLVASRRRAIRSWVRR